MNDQLSFIIDRELTIGLVRARELAAVIIRDLDIDTTVTEIVREGPISISMTLEDLPDYELVESADALFVDGKLSLVGAAHAFEAYTLMGGADEREISVAEIAATFNCSIINVITVLKAHPGCESDQVVDKDSIVRFKEL